VDAAEILIALASVERRIGEFMSAGAAENAEEAEPC
jgi:hypothetical protein